MLLVTPGTWILIQVFNWADYGRLHNGKSVSVGGKIGWVLMEFPAFCAVPVFLSCPNSGEFTSQCMLAFNIRNGTLQGLTLGCGRTYDRSYFTSPVFLAGA